MSHEATGGLRYAARRPAFRTQTMDTLLPALLSLALLDSLNPSALVVALWLLSRPHSALRLLAYVGGILIAYLGLGVAMMLGFGAARDTLDRPQDGVVDIEGRPWHDA